jgi:dihydroxyacid dehydratase/phosphogluconate dehydratase
MGMGAGMRRYDHGISMSIKIELPHSCYAPEAEWDKYLMEDFYYAGGILGMLNRLKPYLILGGEISSWRNDWSYH